MGDTQLCAVHGKNRAMRYLEETTTGRFVCIAGYECKAAGSGAGNDLRVQCTLHGKLRSLDCLQDDGTGKLICTQERRCKTAGQTMPDYRDAETHPGEGTHYGANPYAAYGGGYGYPQYPGAEYGAGAYGGYPCMYPGYGGYPMFPGVGAMPWAPFGAMPRANGMRGGSSDRGRSRSARRRGGCSSSRRPRRRRRRSSSPSHYEASRRRSPSTSQSSRSR